MSRKGVQKIVEDNFLTKNGKVKTASLVKVERGDPQFVAWWDDIVKLTSFLEDDVSPKERIYCAYYGLNEEDVFEDGVKRNFRGFQHGYGGPKKGERKSRSSDNWKPTNKFSPKTREDLIEALNQCAFDKNGVFFTQIVVREQYVTAKLFEYTDFLPNDGTMVERAYCVFNSITELQTCDQCGKKHHNFKDFHNGYRQFCSNECGRVFRVKENRRLGYLVQKGQTLEEAYGKEVADRVRETSSENIKKAIEYNTGKTWEEIMGEEVAKERKDSLKERMRGKVVSEETRRKLSEFHKGRKHPSWEELHGVEGAEKRREQARLRLIQYYYDRDLDNTPAVFYNKKACEFFDYLNKNNGFNGQHATDKGEYLVRELGYFVDFIDFDNKVIIEWDEEQHYYIDNLIEEDAKRQEEIQELFPDFDFIRIRQKNIQGKDFEDIATNIIRRLPSYTGGSKEQKQTAV